MRLTCYALLLLIGWAVPARAQHRYSPEGGAPVPGQPYLAYQAQDSLGRHVQFYVSERSGPEAAPVVLYVQGSGAGSLFVRDGGQLRPALGHATLVDVAGPRGRIVIVEKPGVTPGARATEALPEGFRREHSLERWAEAVAAAFQAARRLPGVDTTRALVIGHSEGGIVAARVAGRLPAVTHLALLAAGGPTQLFDLLELARRGDFFRSVSPEPGVRERFVRTQWDSVLAHPDDPDRLFFGHPYRRWSSFLSSSTLEEVDRTGARLFIAQGDSDEAVSVASFHALSSHLWSRGRDVTVRFVAGADHSFARSESSVDGWAVMLGEIYRWFEGG